MDFLLATIGSHGDVHPFIGLAIRLQQRGHQVRLMCSGYFGALVRSAGIEFIELYSSEEYLALAKNPDMWRASRAFFVLMPAIAESLERVYEILCEQIGDETIVAASSLCMAARVAQDKLNFPMASVHLSPGIFRSIYDPPKLPLFFMPRWMPKWMKRAMWNACDKFVLDPAIAPAVNRLREKVGLAPVRGVLNEWWHSPQCTIGMFPAWFAPPPPDWPPQLRLAGFPLYDERGLTPLSESLEQFLQQGDPPVAFTPGSAMFDGAKFFRAAVDACQRAHLRGILLSRHLEHVPANLPENLIHVDYAPFSQLLPRVAALVHHGGIGTSSQTLAAGVPSLVVPMAHDQFDNAHRLQRLGVAESIPATRFTGRRAAAALSRLLSSADVKTACRAVAARFIAGDGLDQACDMLESLGKQVGFRRQISPALHS